MAKKLSLVVFIFILAIINYSVYKKEDIIKNGKTIYLELAPIDPRSLMQGDYMALRFKLEDNIKQALKKENNFLKNSKGKVLVKLDKNNLANFSNLFIGQKMAKDELILKYKVRDYKVSIGTNAFFFQEGKNKKYQNAKYGKFKLSKNQEIILVDLKGKI